MIDTAAASQPTTPADRRLDATRSIAAYYPLLAPLALLLAAGARFAGLGAGSLWYDEGFSAFVASEPVGDLIAHTARDIHPPLYYLLLHGWMAVAGQSDFSLAFFSFVFGMLLVALAGALGRRWFGARAGLLAALFTALSPFQIWYSQEVRMYTLAAFAGLLLTAALLRGRPRDAMLYAVAGVAGLYALYYVAFLLVALNLVFFGSWLAARRWPGEWPLRRWVLAQIAVIVLYLPWLPVAFRQITSPAVPPWRDAIGPLQAALQTWTALLLGQSVDPGAVWAILLLGLALFALGLSVRNRPAAVAAALAVFLPVGLLLLVSLATPLFHPRYLFTFSPPFLIVIAAGVSCLWKKTPAVALAAAVVLLLGFGESTRAYQFDDAYAPDDYAAAAKVLADRWRPGDAILVNAGYTYAPLIHYWPLPVAWRGRLTNISDAPRADQPVMFETGTIGGPPSLGGGDPLADFYPTTWQDTEGALTALAAKYPRVWMLRAYDTVTDPQGQIRAWLSTNSQQFEDFGFRGASNIRVQGFVLGEAPASSPVIATSGPVSVRGKPRADSAAAGTGIIVDLAWRADGGVTAPLRAYLALVGEDGRIWAQQDEPAIGSRWKPAAWQPGRWTPDPRRLDIPAGTPPGSYRVEIGVYAEDGGAFELRPEGAPAGPRALLGTVQVLPATGLPDPKYGLTINRQLAPNLTLAGAQFGQFEIKAGDTLRVDLYWRATGSLPKLEPVIRVVGADGAVLGESAAMPDGGRYPTTAWLVGELVRDQRELVISPKAQGPARLEAVLGETHITLTSIHITARERRFDVPQLGKPVGARLGDLAELVAADVAVKQNPPDVNITVIWRARAETTTSYTVFFQLLNSAGQVVGQRDQPPRAGDAPTTSWVAGEVVVDSVTITLPPGTPAGDYRVITGMYDPRTGARLPVSSGGDFVDLGTLTLP